MRAPLVFTLLVLGLASCDRWLPFGASNGAALDAALTDRRTENAPGERTIRTDGAREATSLKAFVVTVAGDGNCGEMCGPHGLQVGTDGSLYVANLFSYRVGVLAPPLLPAPSSPRQPTVYAGTGIGGYLDASLLQSKFGSLTAIAALGSDLVVADTGNRRLRVLQAQGGHTVTLAGDGKQGCTAASLGDVDGLAVDGSTIYVADSFCHTVRKVESGVIATFAGNGQALSLDHDDPLQASFLGPHSLAVDSARRLLYVSECAANRVRQIDLATGKVSTLAGNGVASFKDHTDALQASFHCPCGMATHAGRIYVADYDNGRIRAIESGKVTTVAGSGTAGHVDGPALEARFLGPDGLTLDAAAGVLFVTDYDGPYLRAVTGLPH